MRRLFGAVLSRRLAVEIDPATRYMHRRNTAISIIFNQQVEVSVIFLPESNFRYCISSIRIRHKNCYLHICSL